MRVKTPNQGKHPTTKDGPSQYLVTTKSTRLATSMFTQQQQQAAHQITATTTPTNYTSVESHTFSMWQSPAIVGLIF
jgi:hypothetical protein